MSIYHVRRKQPAATRQPAPIPAADAFELTVAGSGPTPEANRASLRKARPVEYMLPATIKWFETLPPQVRPVTLAQQYARIANLLAQQWNDDKACRAYFDDLLTGRREKRRGFPVTVRRELWHLREYYQRTRLTNAGHLAVV